MFVDIDSDTGLNEALDKVLSGCLPHKNYEPKLFNHIVNRVTLLFSEDEFSTKYFVFMQALNNLVKVSSVVSGFSPNFSRLNLELSLKNSVFEIINNPIVGMSDWLERNGLDSDMNIPRVSELAANKLFHMCMEYYDKLYEMANSSNDSLTLMPVLMESVRTNLIQGCVRTQVTILNSNFRWGRNTYSGSQGWIDFTDRFKIYLNNRLSVLDNLDKLVNSSTIEEQMRMRKVAKDLYKPLFNVGLKPIDEQTPITQHSYFVIVGEEGLGKTQLALHMANSLILEGKDVVYMNGESRPELLNTRLESNYLFRTTGYKVSSDIIPFIDEYEEDLQKVVNAATLDRIKPSNGGLFYNDQFSYQNFEAEVDAIMEQYPKTGAIIIDHSGLLKSIDKFSKKSTSEIMSDWSRIVIKVKNKYPISIIVLSHPGSEAKGAINKGKRPDKNPTAGTGQISKDADYVLILSQTPELKSRSLISFAFNKVRNFSSGIKPFLIKTEFGYGAFIYDESLQAYDNTNVNATIANIVESITGEDDSDNDIFDSGFEDDFSEYEG